MREGWREGGKVGGREGGKKGKEEAVISAGDSEGVEGTNKRTRMQPSLDKGT